MRIWPTPTCFRTIKLNHDLSLHCYRRAPYLQVDARDGQPTRGILPQDRVNRMDCNLGPHPQRPCSVISEGPVPHQREENMPPSKACGYSQSAEQPPVEISGPGVVWKKHVGAERSVSLTTLTCDARSYGFTSNFCPGFLVESQPSYPPSGGS